MLHYQVPVQVPVVTFTMCGVLFAISGVDEASDIISETSDGGMDSIPEGPGSSSDSGISSNSTGGISMPISYNFEPS